MEECGGVCSFNVLLTKNVPHILEKIFFLLDYESFKACIEVNSSLSELLKSAAYTKKARSVFWEEIDKQERQLLFASRDGRTDVVGRLLSTGMLEVDCTPLHANARGDVFRFNTPLLEAVVHGQHEVVQFLIERGADPNKPYRHMPMNSAAQKGHEKVVRVFLDAGMDPDESGRQGYTPMHFAARNGHKNVVRMLIDAGAHIDKTNQFGDTPLHWAADEGQSDMYQFLLDNGADPNKADNAGSTPCYIADIRIRQGISNTEFLILEEDL